MCNPPAYTSKDTISFAQMMGFEVSTAPNYCPESTGMAEAFIETLKRDYMYPHDLPDAESVAKLLTLCFQDYTNRPNKGLEMSSLSEYGMCQDKLEGCPV